MQSRRISIEDDDNVKLSLAHIKKILKNIEIAPSTKVAVNGDELDVSIRKISNLIG